MLDTATLQQQITSVSNQLATAQTNFAAVVQARADLEQTYVSGKQHLSVAHDILNEAVLALQNQLRSLQQTLDAVNAETAAGDTNAATSITNTVEQAIQQAAATPVPTS